MKSALRRAGALAAAMSGSGSTVFGLFQRRPDAERGRGSAVGAPDGACCSPSRWAAESTRAAAAPMPMRRQTAGRARHEEI